MLLQLESVSIASWKCLCVRYVLSECVVKDFHFGLLKALTSKYFKFLLKHKLKEIINNFKKKISLIPGVEKWQVGVVYSTPQYALGKFGIQGTTSGNHFKILCCNML